MSRELLRGPKGAIGRLIERLPNDIAIVEVGDRVLRWHHARRIRTEPQGVVKASDRALAVVRAMDAEGITQREAAERFGIGVRAVQEMVRRVRASDQEERNRRANG